MPKPNAPEPLELGSHGNGAPAETSEDRRLAARRRFLKGGAAALPVLVTLGHKEAFAASMQVCMSANVGQGFGLTAEEQQTYNQGINTSLFCRF